MGDNGPMGEVTPFERRRAPEPSPLRDLATAQRLTRQGRWSEARDLLTSDHAASAEALELRGSLRYLLGDSKGCFEDLAHAFQVHDRPDRAARCAAWLGILHLIRGESGHSRGWFTTARRLVDEHGECAASAYLRVLPIIGDQSAGREEAISTARGVHAIARRYDDTDAVALTGQTLGQLLIRTGGADEGRDLMDEAMVVAVSGQLSSPLVEVLVLLAVMEGCQLLADIERAREWASTVARLRARYPELVAFTGVFALDRVRLAVASAEWVDAISALDEVDPALAGEADRLRGDIHRARGELDVAAAAYARATGAAAGTALLELRAGRPAAAAARVRRALATATDDCDRAVLLPAAVEILVTDDPVEAAALAAELASIGTLLSSPLLTARGRLAAAEVALATGELDRALTEVTAALARFDALRVPAEQARAHTVAAAVRTARNEPDGAAIERRAAAELAVQWGLAQVGGASEEPPAPVSARELDVLRQLAAGATNREIADALTLSPRTVDRHVSNIFTKIGVATRAAAAAYAVEHGLA